MSARAIEAWRARGRVVSTPDGDVFAMEAGPRDAHGPPLLVLHGFPTSSWDFAPVIERIATRRRVVAFDFLGYGLSDKPAGFGYSLFEQADVAIAVARAFGIDRAHLWAHDMGTSVATELLARRERGLLPIDLATVALMNGSVHIEMAHLTVGQKILKTPLAAVFARLSSRATFKAQIRRVFARPPADEDLDVMWELLAREGGAARMPQLIAYTEERARFRERWIGALSRLDRPLLVAWGKRDPVAVFAIAERIAKDTRGARLVAWDDLGHYPQVEDPARVARVVGEFWDGAGAFGA